MGDHCSILVKNDCILSSGKYSCQTILSRDLTFIQNNAAPFVFDTINHIFIIAFKGKLGGSISVAPIHCPDNNVKIDKVNLCFWTTTHMIADDENSTLNVATLDGKILQWKLVDEQKPSTLDTSLFKIMGLHDRFSLEYANSMEISLGYVTAFCYNAKRYTC